LPVAGGRPACDHDPNVGKKRVTKLGKHKAPVSKRRPAKSGWLAAAAFAALASSGASSQELPPITSELVNRAAVLCIKVDDGGAVSEAFIAVSAGNAATDRALLAWVRQVHWQAGPGEPWRNRWFPMPIAFGNATPPNPPATCVPPSGPQST
jgi:TonB family protein